MSTQGKLLEKLVYLISQQIDGVEDVSRDTRIIINGEVFTPAHLQKPMRVDVQFALNGERYCIECKTQNTSGSAKDKLFEVERCAKEINRRSLKVHYWLVIAGAYLTSHIDSYREVHEEIEKVLTLGEYFDFALSNGINRSIDIDPNQMELSFGQVL